MAYIQGSKLDVGILVPYPPLQCAHGIFRLHRFGPNHVGYLEVQWHVFSAQLEYRTIKLGGMHLGHTGSTRLRALSARRARWWTKTRTSPPWYVESERVQRS